MKKNIISVIVFTLCTFFVFSQTKNFKNPNQIVPKEIQKAFPIGMNEADFKKANPNLGVDNSFGFRNVYEIYNFSDDIKEIVFYFNNKGKNELYEYIIQYKSEELRNKAIKKYKAPNKGKEWEWTSKDNLKFKAWIFSNTLVIAVAYPNSEWYNE